MNGIALQADFVTPCPVNTGIQNQTCIDQCCQVGKELSGVKLSKRVLQTLQTTIEEQALHPLLAIILVGNNPASRKYVEMKRKACQQLNIAARVIELPESTPEEVVLAKIQECNADSTVHGILVQLPLPKPLNTENVVNTIEIKKDVDGLTTQNMEYLKRGKPSFHSCTAAGMMELLKSTGLHLKGKKAALVGYGPLVGQPLHPLLEREGIEVEIFQLPNNPVTAQKCRQADIVMTGAGVAHLITSEFVKPGAVVIDAGFARDKQGRACGDVDFEQVKRVASYITPNPGGVGPMTIAMLLHNVVIACQKQILQP